MLDLQAGGRCMSGPEAVEFFESLADVIGEEVRTEDFCDEYTRALNRLRYEVRKSVPCPVKVYKGHFTSYSCGQCGHGVTPGNDYCGKCGRQIKWQ